MTQNNGRKKRDIINVIKSITDLPGETGNGFSLHMRGEREMYICGCRRILEYSQTKISLSIKGFALIIRGEGLTCISYFERAVGIEGKIDSIEIDRGER